MTAPTNHDPNASRISASAVDRDGDVLYRSNGVFVSEGIPQRVHGGTALASSNTTDAAHAWATTVAASASNTPKPVDAATMSDLLTHPGGVHGEA